MTGPVATEEVLAQHIVRRIWALEEQKVPSNVRVVRDLWSDMRRRFPRQEQDLRLRLKYSWLTRRSCHPDFWTPSISLGDASKRERAWPRFYVHVVRRKLEIHDSLFSPDRAESSTRAALSPLLTVESQEGYRALPDIVLDSMDSIAFDSILVCDPSNPAITQTEVRIAQVLRRAWLWSMRQPWFVPSQFYRALRHGRA